VNELPFEVRFELPGWALFWALLEPAESDHSAELAALRARVAQEARARHTPGELSAHPTVAALRTLFRAAGTDPTRYRPSSEALLRRLLKGDELPEIHPLVDLNNCLSAQLAVPCCVMAEETVEPPFDLRAGRPGEAYESLRGPFRLEGRPLLVDARGPCDTPITGSQRVKIGPDSRRVWLVAYLPREVIAPEEAASELAQLLAAVPVALSVITAAAE
jgi:DNA/RNA-binding domain of Phe-tRNA-synthetase-like protein